MGFPEKWHEFFDEEKKKPYFAQLIKFVKNEYATKTVYPKKQDVFKVFELIGPDEVKIVILGQDPYPKPNQANGIAFSAGTSQTPMSLLNIFKELKDDLDIDHFANNDLSAWVEQGVFLINTILTVEPHKPLSHQNKGWEIFVENLLTYLAKKKQIIFCAFGNSAYNIYSKIKFIDKNLIIRVGHPSPLSYQKYFKGSRPFTKINDKLSQLNLDPIDWAK